MRFSTNKILVLTFALAIGVVGCGDDDGGGSGGTSGGGSGGNGGSGGTGGMGGTGGTGGSAFMCGTTTCDPLPAGIALPIPGVPSPENCCTTGDNLCGIASDGLLMAGTCLEQNAPGQDSDQCPNEMLAFANPLSADGGTFPIPLTGCCRPDNTCGLSSTLMVPIIGSLELGTGCTERTVLSSSLAMPPSPAWAAATCVYSNTATDAGTDDAGN